MNLWWFGGSGSWARNGATPALLVVVGLLIALPGRGAAADDWRLSDVGFLTGCWRAGDGATYFEEIYTEPTENLILGLSRFVRDGRAVSFEMTRVQSTDQGIVMTPYPDGIQSEHGFVLTSLQDGLAIFEAPEHDYPKRILYRKNADGSRTARIDGGAEDDGGQEWRFEPAPCPSH